MSESKTMDSPHILEHLPMKGSWDGVSIPETLEELNRVKKHLIDDYFGQIQKAFLLKALKECRGNITRAAEKVGMKRPNFHSLMKKHQLTTKTDKG